MEQRRGSRDRGQRHADRLHRRRPGGGGEPARAIRRRRLGRQTQTKRGGTVIAEQAYNADGTLASRKDGDAGSQLLSSFTYDWAKRLASVDLPNTEFSSAVPTFAWRLDGLIAARTWSGSSATFAYDAAKRLTGITKGSLTESQAYDRDGNVTSEARSLTGVSGDPGTGTQSFSYDALNRVTGSSGLASGSRSYTYDRDGNRLTKTEGGITFTSVYDRTDELVSIQKTGGSTQSYTYDAYGNLTGNAETAAAVTTMTYDLASKLTGIDATGTANDATFTFDALGRFRTRVLSATTDTYSYVGTGETVTRIANSGGSTTDSIVSPSGDRLGVKVGATVNWFLPDPHGNIAASLDAAETTVVNALRYDAYGQTIATGTAGGSPVAQDTWKYQGRLDISPTGLGTPLYDMSARFYSPGIGAFTQLDSVMGSAQNPLSMNRFLYAEGNPATLIDPSGHQPCGPDGMKCTPTTARTQAKTSKPTPTKDSWGGSDDRESNRIKSVQRTSTTAAARAAEAKASDDRESNRIKTASAGNQKAMDKSADERESGSINARATAPLPTNKSEGFDLGGFVHGVLDVAGMIPVLGAIPDLANAGLYALSGDWGNAAFSAASAIPLAGDMLGAGKLAIKYGDDVIGLVASKGDDVIGIVTKQTDEAAGVLAGGGRGGIGPVVKGQEGVARAEREIASDGGEVIGREITISTPVGRTRVDLGERTSAGDIGLVEVKNGPKARVNPNQERVFAYIREHGGTPVGQRAAEAGFVPGKPIPPTPVTVKIYP